MRVGDTGCGIAKEHMPHVFERFFKADPAREFGEHTSSGLGLALVHEIVTSYSGVITVESVVNVGTTFSVTL